jgi:exosortase A-associated hydrolase 1
MVSLIADTRTGAAVASEAALASEPGMLRLPDFSERALCFEYEGERLVGVLASPATPAATGLVIVVGGPQYRAGSHRHFVQLARALAASGWPVLRFDVRGMGDSSGPLHGFEEITPDIGAAIDELFRQLPGLRRVVLWGLCDAATAALLYLDERPDSRVAGLALLNPWVRAPETLARAQVKQYYARRLLAPATWRALASGRIGWRSIADFAGAVRRAVRRGRPRAFIAALSFQQRMARGWIGFGGPTLLVLSGRDLTALEFTERMRSDPALAKAAGRDRVTTHSLDDADHTLSSADASDAHLKMLVTWLRDADSRGDPLLGHRSATLNSRNGQASCRP